MIYSTNYIIWSTHLILFKFRWRCGHRTLNCVRPSTLFCNPGIDFHWAREMIFSVKLTRSVTAQQSCILIRSAEPSVTIAHDTHSVVILNLSWQHSGELLVFANFCLSQSKLPIEKRPRSTRVPAFNFDPRPEPCELGIIYYYTLFLVSSFCIIVNRHVSPHPTSTAIWIRI